MRLISDEPIAVVTILSEAANQPEAVKLGIAEAILNRMNRKVLSDGTLVGTVARRFQFSAWNDDPRDNQLLIRCLQADNDDKAVRECLLAWRSALAGSRTVAGATHFFDVHSLQQQGLPRPSWSLKMKLVATLGTTEFYV